MVELSNEMLETYQMTLYKALSLKTLKKHCPPFSTVWMLTKEGKESEGSGGRRTNPVRLLSIAPAKRRCQPVHPVQNR